MIAGGNRLSPTESKTRTDPTNDGLNLCVVGVDAYIDPFNDTMRADVGVQAERRSALGVHPPLQIQ